MRFVRPQIRSGAGSELVEGSSRVPDCAGTTNYAKVFVAGNPGRRQVDRSQIQTVSNCAVFLDHPLEIGRPECHLLPERPCRKSRTRCSGQSFAADLRARTVRPEEMFAAFAGLIGTVRCRSRPVYAR